MHTKHSTRDGTYNYGYNMVNTTKTMTLLFKHPHRNPTYSGYFRTNEDNVEIYFEVYGEGPSIICNNGVGVSTFFGNIFDSIMGTIIKSFYGIIAGMESPIEIFLIMKQIFP